MNTTFGCLASDAGYHLPLQVLRSANGFYLGTYSDHVGPITRESEQYWCSEDAAQRAMSTGNWTQRDHL